MPNYGYHLARVRGRMSREFYRAFLSITARAPVVTPGDISLDVFSYCGEAGLPEQVASIRSFLRYAGRPKRFTVVSDGTISGRSTELLRSIDSVVSVEPASHWVPTGLNSAVYPYLTTHVTGRQLGLIMSLPVDLPALYVDSDVLFFPGADDLHHLAVRNDVSALYQQDCRLSADDRLFRDESEKVDPVNTGCLLLFQKLDWSRGLQRLLDLTSEPNFFTNQTITHLTMHANSALAFDPRKYVLQLADQFIYRDLYADPKQALRHYVNPVRHKFWTSV